MFEWSAEIIIRTATTAMSVPQDQSLATEQAQDEMIILGNTDTADQPQGEYSFKQTFTKFEILQLRRKRRPVVVKGLVHDYTTSNFAKMRLKL